MDDNDIARLYPVAHWRELPDELSAYMGFTLRNLGSGAAAVSTEGCPTGAKFRLLIPFT
jgi:hypothetical protein